MDDDSRETSHSRKRDTSRKRLSLLDAAITAFLNSGFENTSMDTVAQIAGASKRTLYNHFPSKEVLFRSMIHHVALEMNQLKQIAFEPGEALELQLRRFAEAEVALVSNPQWLGIMKMIMALQFQDADFARQIDEQYLSTPHPIVRWLEAARGQGLLAFDDVELVSRVFLSLLSGAISWPSLSSPHRGFHDNGLIDELIQVFLERYRRREP